jgi:hypothetical protein
MRKYWIEATSPTSCRLSAKDVVNSWSLPLPISAEDAHALVLATFRAPEDGSCQRREFHGVLADKLSDGVRVRIVADMNHFDFPWSHIAAGLEVKELAQ